MIRGTLGLAGRRFRFDRGESCSARRPARGAPRPAPARYRRHRGHENVEVGSSSPAARPIRRSSSPPRPAARGRVVSRICSAAGDPDLGASGGPARRLAPVAEWRRRRPESAGACARRTASTGCASSTPTPPPAAAPRSPPHLPFGRHTMWRSSPTPGLYRDQIEISLSRGALPALAIRLEQRHQRSTCATTGIMSRADVPAWPR